MLTTFEDVIVILACTLGAVLFLRILDHFWPSSRRRDHNDIIGWQVSCAWHNVCRDHGIHAVRSLCFYQSAEINADAEANCLVSVFRLADGLPTAQRDQVHQLAREYARVVIDEEWPAMHTGQLGSAGHNTIQNLWNRHTGN